MRETLALKYRPRTFSDITGQKATRVVLREFVRKDEVPPGLLFHGVRGTGKTTAGRILAAALNCEAEERPCTQCAECKAIVAGNSLSVLELDAASNGNVGAIRNLTEQLRYSVGGKYRVVLLDEAHSMSREAFDALLKTLEEPPPGTIFVLLTTEKGRIPETVESRLMPFEFQRISVAEIVSRLDYICQQEGFNVTPELLVHIAERSRGGLRDSVMTLDQVTRVGVRTPEEFALLIGEVDFAPDLVSAMLDGDVGRAMEVLDGQLTRSGDMAMLSSQIVYCLRDLLVLHSGGKIASQGRALEVRRALVARTSAASVFAAMRVLWELKTKVRHGDDLRAALELAVVVCLQALSGEFKQSVPRQSAPSGGKMSLDGMRRAVGT